MDRNLKAFIAIAEERNLSRAAHKIGLGQSSLTKKLQLMEAEYGGRLFDRLPRGVALTRLGACLYEHAKKIEREYLFTREDIDALKSGHLAQLRVDAGPTFHLLYISKVFAQLRKEFPDTKLILSTKTNPVPLPDLLNDKLDIVAGRLVPMEKNTGVMLQSILTIEHGIVVAENHPLTQLQSLEVGDLIGHDWLIYGDSPTGDKILTDYFHRRQLAEPEIAVYTSSFATALQLISSEGYLMSAPTILRSIIEESGARILSITPPIHRFEAGVYIRETSMKYPIIQRFLEILTRQLTTTRLGDVG